MKTTDYQSRTALLEPQNNGKLNFHNQPKDVRTFADFRQLQAASDKYYDACLDFEQDRPIAEDWMSMVPPSKFIDEVLHLYPLSRYPFDNCRAIIDSVPGNVKQSVVESLDRYFLATEAAATARGTDLLPTIVNNNKKQPQSREDILDGLPF